MLQILLDGYILVGGFFFTFLLDFVLFRWLDEKRMFGLAAQVMVFILVTSVGLFFVNLNLVPETENIRKG